MSRRGADILGGIPLFAGLSRRHLRRLGDRTEEVRFAEGATVAEEGKPGDTFYVLVEGEARVIRGVRTIARLFPGDFFGEVSLIDGGPRTATIRAETPLTTLALSRPAFRGVIEDEPSVVLKLLNELALRLRRVERPLAG